MHKKSYLWGYLDKALDKSPKNGKDLLAFEACIVEQSVLVAPSSPLLKVPTWSHQGMLSWEDRCLTQTPSRETNNSEGVAMEEIIQHDTVRRMSIYQSITRSLNEWIVQYGPFN